MKMIERIARQTVNEFWAEEIDDEFVTMINVIVERIDAERGKSAVAYAATSEEGKVEALGFNQSRRFDTPLFLSPTIPEWMCIVPINEIQSVKVQGDSAVVIQVTSCRAACEIKARIAAAQGERNAD